MPDKRSFPYNSKLSHFIAQWCHGVPETVQNCLLENSEIDVFDRAAVSKYFTFPTPQPNCPPTSTYREGAYHLELSKEDFQDCQVCNQQYIAFPLANLRQLNRIRPCEFDCVWYKKNWVYLVVFQENGD